MSDLAEAIKDLIIEYEKARKVCVVNALCYALHQTWLKYEELDKQVELLKGE